MTKENLLMSVRIKVCEDTKSKKINYNHKTNKI